MTKDFYQSNTYHRTKALASYTLPLCVLYLLSSYMVLKYPPLPQPIPIYLSPHRQKCHTNSNLPSQKCVPYSSKTHSPPFFPHYSYHTKSNSNPSLALTNRIVSPPRSNIKLKHQTSPPSSPSASLSAPAPPPTPSPSSSCASTAAARYAGAPAPPPPSSYATPRTSSPQPAPL